MYLYDVAICCSQHIRNMGLQHFDFSCIKLWNLKIVVVVGHTEWWQHRLGRRSYPRQLPGALGSAIKVFKWNHKLTTSTETTAKNGETKKHIARACRNAKCINIVEPSGFSRSGDWGLVPQHMYAYVHMCVCVYVKPELKEKCWQN